MMQTRDLENKFNEKAADYAVKSEGYCERLREFVSDYDEELKHESIGYFLSSCEYCEDCEKKRDGGCRLLQVFGDFKEGAEWLLGQVSQNLAERYIIEHIGIRT